MYVTYDSGQSWTPQQKLVASNGAADDKLGFVGAVYSSTIVAGAHGNDNVGGTNAGTFLVFMIVHILILIPCVVLTIGAVYIFFTDDNGLIWSQQQILLASDGATNAEFGEAVALHADSLVVGAYGDDDNGGAAGLLDVSLFVLISYHTTYFFLAGAAYVFLSNDNGQTWSQTQKMIASDGAGADFYGYAVAVYKTAIVVGAWLDDNAKGTDAGKTLCVWPALSCCFTDRIVAVCRGGLRVRYD